jgi:hypothetical protein
MATKTKKTRKSKKTESVESEVVAAVVQPVRRRLLPHNMAHEIILLQQRVAELEKRLNSALEQLSTK